MCVDPISAAVMTAVGTGAGIYSKVKQGQAERKVADKNAAAYEAQAGRRLEKAEFDVAKAQREYAKFKGAVDSRVAASGFDPGNFAEIAAANAAEADLEYQSIRYTAAIEADQLRTTGQITRESGRDAQRGSYLDAAAIGIRGVSALQTPFDSASSVGSWSTTTYDAKGNII